ncbi:MAG TPA: CPBP family intramembrane glutamic endopeptidase [Candidatus Bilamarchaeum sp.]|nr:CPBP family intramembrane glutamic endopeptidase [Candidatus Bilamarchaeum sp.]
MLAFASVLICPAFSMGFCSFLVNNNLVIGTAALHLGILSLALFFLWKEDLRSTLKALGIPGDLKDNLVYSAATLGAMFLLSLLVGIASFVFGFSDQAKIAEKISGLPVAMLVAAALLAPIGEELFFRATLVPRIGPILSSILFGIVHFTYGSVAEVVGVLLLGFVLALSFQKSRSILPCILSHMAYNGLSILVMLSVYRGVG